MPNGDDLKGVSNLSEEIANRKKIVELYQQALSEGNIDMERININDYYDRYQKFVSKTNLIEKPAIEDGETIEFDEGFFEGDERDILSKINQFRRDNLDRTYSDIAGSINKIKGFNYAAYESSTDGGSKLGLAKGVDRYELANDAYRNPVFLKYDKFGNNTTVTKDEFESNSFFNLLPSTEKDRYFDPIEV